jgi:hypothetical protein
MVTIGNSGLFPVYCVSLLDELESSQEVAARQLSDLSNPGLVNNAGSRVAWLLNEYGSDVDSDTKGAALQLSIWEALYDEQLNLGTGWLKALVDFGNDPEILNMASNHLNALSAINPVGSNGIWYDVARGQDLASPVPEPGSLLLLSSGIGALGLALARRRKSAAAPK